MLDREEHVELLAQSTGSVAYPKGKTVADLWEAQVVESPEAVAVVYEGKAWTYREFNEMANRLAHHLQSKFQVEADDLVGIHMPTSDGALLALLATLKAGAAYVPVDVELPVARKQYLLEDTQVKALISDAELPDTLQAFHTKSVVLPETLNYTEDSGSIENPLRNQQADSLAYVIYTSGSTGQSKGVLISHQNLVDYVYGLMVTR